MLTYRNTGTSLRGVAHVMEGQTIALELDLTEVHLRTPADGIELGKDENGKLIRATELVTATLKTRLRMRSGHAVATLEARPAAKSQPARLLVIVAGRVLEPGLKVSK